MTFTESIKNGFRIINKNWQLVLIQAGAMFASFIGFFVIVGIPLAIAFIIFGLDLISLTEISSLSDVFRTFKDPAGILSKYFGLVILVLVSLLFYITVLLIIGIFVFGGSMGVIGRSLKNDAEEFKFKTFFSEGRRLFFPLMWFTTIIGLIIILFAFILGIFGGAIAAIVSLAKEQEAVLGLFVGIFFSFIMFLAGIVLILLVLAVTIYGAAAISIKGSGAAVSIKEAVLYLYRHPRAFYLYCIVFVGYVVASFFTFFLGFPMKFIPFIGPLMAVVYQLGVYVVQNYIGLVIIATIFSYYYSTGMVSPADKGTFPEERSASQGSIQTSDISEPQAPAQGDVPPEKGTSQGT